MSKRLPSSSRLTVKSRRNRKRPSSLWSRIPEPKVLVDACGRLVRRAVPATIATTIAAVIGTGAWLGYGFVTTSPRFAITSIEIRGNAQVPEAAIRAVLPVHVGDNVFGTDLEATTRAVLADPWIATADVHRILPHTLVVEVHERSAVAIAELGGLYLVDAGGHPFKRAAIDTGEGTNLPIITGLDRDAYRVSPDESAGLIRTALAALADWRTVTSRPPIGEVNIDGYGTLTLHTYEHATAIQLGALGPELANRMHTFDAAWAELTDVERERTRAIHLDARTDHVTVAFAKD